MPIIRPIPWDNEDLVDVILESGFRIRSPASCHVHGIADDGHGSDSSGGPQMLWVRGLQMRACSPLLTGRPNDAAPRNSTATNGSDPTTHSSCPGGIA